MITTIFYIRSIRVIIKHGLDGPSDCTLPNIRRTNETRKSPQEAVLIGYKDQWKKQNEGISTIDKDSFMMGCSGIWNLRTETQQQTKANFHTDLPELCIKLLSFKGDIVLDPFIGSGTTAVAAKNWHREFVGIELSPRYYAVAKERVLSTIPMFEQLLVIEEKELKPPTLF